MLSLKIWKVFGLINIVNFYWRTHLKQFGLDGAVSPWEKEELNNDSCV